MNLGTFTTSGQYCCWRWVSVSQEGLLENMIRILAEIDPDVTSLCALIHSLLHFAFNLLSHGVSLQFGPVTWFSLHMLATLQLLLLLFMSPALHIWCLMLYHSSSNIGEDVQFDPTLMYDDFTSTSCLNSRLKHSVVFIESECGERLVHEIVGVFVPSTGSTQDLTAPPESTVSWGSLWCTGVGGS